MIKRLLSIAILMLYASPVMAVGDFVCRQGAQDMVLRQGTKDLVVMDTYVAPSGDSQITYYFNCDSDVTGQSPTKGSGTITIEAAVNTAAGQVSNAIDVPNTGYTNARFPVSGGNFDAAIGTIGFYYYEASRSNGSILIDVYSAPKFNFYGNTFNSTHTFDYKSGSINLSINTSTWYFVELSWDSSNNKMSARLNGGAWTEVTGLSGATPSVTNVTLGSNDGNGRICYIDQVIVSNVYQKDLYSVRNNTSF